MKKLITPILLLSFVLFFSGLCYKENFASEKEEVVEKFNGQQCAAITNCRDCTAASSCAWCLNKQQCVPTDRFGVPIGRECMNNDVATFPSNCGNVASGDGGVQTIQPPQGSSGSNVTVGPTLPNWLRNSLGGNVNTSTYDTGAYTATFNQQFYNNPAGAPQMPASVNTRDAVSPSQTNRLFESALTNRSQTTCPDYTKVETSIKNNLGSNVKNILKTELQRAGLQYIEGFDTLRTTQTAVQASINDDITRAVRKSIAAKKS